MNVIIVHTFTFTTYPITLFKYSQITHTHSTTTKKFDIDNLKGKISFIISQENYLLLSKRNSPK